MKQSCLKNVLVRIQSHNLELVTGVLATMKKLMTLRTERGKRVLIHLDNWGVGTDRLYRRWTLEHDGWHCLETGEIGRRSGFIFGGITRLLPRIVGP